MTMNHAYGVPRAIRDLANTLKAAWPVLTVLLGIAGGVLPEFAAAQTAPLAEIQAVAAGYEHTCALTTSGGVKCWGGNVSGQLGDGTMSQRWAPGYASGLSRDVVAIAVGGNHSCALTSGGSVKCWGGNLYGELGNGDNVTQLAPAQVLGLSSGVLAIATGDNFTCALTAVGGVKCWGLNSFGQLGDGGTTNRSVPVDVVGVTSGAIAITGGTRHACALMSGGGVKCWGSGALGDGTLATQPTMVSVSGLSGGVAKIAAGSEFTCAQTLRGEVKCWGFGAYVNGQLNWDFTPADVPGLGSGVVGIEAGGETVCALVSDGGIKCWGKNWYANAQGKVGDGSTGDRWTPVDVSGLAGGATGISVGTFHTCAVIANGGVKCWGDNRSGQLGIVNAYGFQSSPGRVTNLGPDVLALVGGSAHSCAMTAGGAAKCWGDNGSGQLGDGSDMLRTSPVNVSGLSGGVTAIAAGASHTCAVVGGGVKCWGQNGNFQLGVLGSNTSRLVPTDVWGLSSGMRAITAGEFHTCALNDLGEVKCWGDNSHGQLGNDSIPYFSLAVDVVGLGTGMNAVAAGAQHTCALSSTGGVKCWGLNASGQLGDGSAIDRPTPVDVFGLSSGVANIAAGEAHTCALTTGGGVKCWGFNGDGQLGNNSTTDSSTPVDVSGLASGVVAIAASEGYTCALTNAGGVRCWGFVVAGEIDYGRWTSRLVPVEVPGLASGVERIAAAGWHTCAVTASDGVNCWGDNSFGQIGNGTSGVRPLPVDVLISPPGAPNSVIAYGGSASAHVSFSVPAMDGGAAIDNYRATCNPGSIAATGTTSPISVSGLINGSTYTCTVAAHNSVGWGPESVTSNSVTLLAPEAPTAPTNVTGTPGDRQISVAFTGSALAGNLAGGAAATITGYTATCGSRSAAGTGSPIVVGGLSNGTSYSCTVTATNNVPLTSAASAPAAAVTPRATVPQPPDIDTVKPGNAGVSVAFTAPASDGGAAIDNYRVTCNPGSVTATGTTSPISVSGLINSSTYTCTVAAHNSVGWSAESAISNPVTPAAASKTQRAFVSAKLGNDANSSANCPATAPCRSFASAVGVVIPGGEVVAMHSGEYGAVTLTNSVALVGAPGAQVSITASSGNAVSIATPGIDVVLRGLSVTGPGAQANGIVMTAGASLSVENCVLSRLGDAISVTGSTRVDIVNTTVRDSSRGIYLVDGVHALIARAKLGGVTGRGIIIGGLSPNTKTVAAVVDSTVSGNRGRNDEWALMGASSNYTAAIELSILRSVLTDSNTGLMAGSLAGGPVSVTIAQSRVTGNVYGLQGGVIYSLGNNVLTDNATDSLATVVSVPRQ